MATTYPVTVRDGIWRYCTACQVQRLIYVQVENGERLTCCATCSRILQRELEVNGHRTLSV